jgi:hypothetical protein
LDIYELPLKVSNGGTKDVDDIRLLVDVEGGELIVPSDWGVETYADNTRYRKLITHLPPMSAQKLFDIKIRVKNTTHEARIKWTILAKHTMPTNGALIFRF